LNQLVQTLLAQLAAVVHGCPSFALQAPLAKVCPAGQLQRPALQPRAPQETPQPPQFAPSVWKLTQRLPPHALGLVPEHWQVPATQEPTEQLLAAVLQAWPRPTLLSTQAPFWQTCPPPQLPGWPFATVPQTPVAALHVEQGPPQLQHCELGMHTLFAQARGAFAGH
jgi:hypothetical protein